MDNPISNILVKFFVTIVLAGFAFILMNGNAVSLVVLAAILVSVLNYFVGDVLTLPRLGTVFTYLVKGVLSALVIYLMALALPAFVVTLASLATFAVLVGIAEYFIQTYLIRINKETN